MHKQSESESRDANGALVSSDELTTRYACGGVLGVVVAMSLIFGFSIASNALCIAIIVIAVCTCGFLAARYGDRFWEGLINLFIKPGWW